MQNLILIIGNNAGRLQTANYFPDENDNDRAFAYNCSKELKKDIQFRTPEQIFLKNTESRKWSWRMPAFDQLLTLQSQSEPSFQEIINLDSNKTAVIISGPPVSTKSTLSKRIKGFIEKSQKQCVIYDSNDYDTFVQFMQDIKPEGNIIIAGVFETNEKRNELWRKLDSYNKIFIEIATHRTVCEFLNHFRLQICSSPAILETKKIEFDTYYKFYQIPELDYISYPLVLRNKL